MASASKELHPYPGAKQLLWVVRDKVEIRAEAWGGEASQPGARYDTMSPRKTTPGHYIIYSYEPYHTKTWTMSQIPWGTPVAKGPNDTILYPSARGQMPSVVLVDKKGQSISAAAVEDEYFRLFGKAGFPQTRVFNDFGPWAVRYFRDLNRNGRLDRGEKLSGEMIHTTPDNEAESSKGEAVNMFESPGCVHIKPTDRDSFHRSGAFARGNVLVIHSYQARVPRAWQ